MDARARTEEKRLPPALVITIDVEPDNEWGRPPPGTCHNIRPLEAFHERCRAQGITPTYLLSYGMVTDGEALAGLARILVQGGCEIGAHLHPWETPPFAYADGADNGAHAFPHELPEELFEAKLATVTDAIVSRLGVRPVSYRAGRWGMSHRCLGPLIRQGYRVDTSVTPLYSWHRQVGLPNGDGGPAYLTAPQDPYHPSPHDICLPGDSPLWEVPLTIGLPGPLSALRTRIHRVTGSRVLFSRVARRSGILRLQWLQPTRGIGRTTEALCRLARHFVQRGAPVLNMMFHSSELMEGGSPYHPTAVEVAEFERRIWDTLSYICTDLRARPVRLCESVA